jgi:hypothetical protein
LSLDALQVNNGSKVRGQGEKKKKERKKEKERK